MAKGTDATEIAPKRGPGRPRGSVGKAKQSASRDDLRNKLKQQKQNFVQEEILHAAAELIAARGFRAVTIDDISASLGFSKSVIYYYLESKNDILWRIFSRIYECYFEGLERISRTELDADEKLYQIVHLHATLVMTNRAWTAISQREESELDDKQRKQIVTKKRQYDATVEAIYKEGVEEGRFIDVPPQIAVNALLGAANSIYTWFKPDGKLTAEQIADHYANLLANGFRINPGTKTRSLPATVAA